MENENQYTFGIFFRAMIVVLVLLSVIPLIALFVLFMIVKGCYWIKDKLVAGKFSRDISKLQSADTSPYNDAPVVLSATLNAAREEILNLWENEGLKLKMVSDPHITISNGCITFKILYRQRWMPEGYSQHEIPCSAELHKALSKILTGNMPEEQLQQIVLCYKTNDDGKIIDEVMALASECPSAS